MTLLQRLVYGFISGLCDFFPVSQQAHQSLTLQIFGAAQREPLMDIFVHIGIIFALYITCASSISRLRRDRKLAARISGRRSRAYDMRGLYELRLLRAAVLPMLAGMLIYFVSAKLESRMVWISLFLLINGVLLLIPEHMRQGNKDARSMSGFDALLIGLSGLLSALPGISRVGFTLGVCSARGTDRQQALSWALLLSIPATMFLLLYDLVSMFIIGIGVGSFLDILGCLISSVGAFCGAYASITVMRNLAVRTGYAGFAYYCWGAALFTFILYLIT